MKTNVSQCTRSFYTWDSSNYGLDLGNHSLSQSSLSLSLSLAWPGLAWLAGPASQSVVTGRPRDSSSSYSLRPSPGGRESPLVPTRDSEHTPYALLTSEPLVSRGVRASGRQASRLAVRRRLQRRRRSIHSTMYRKGGGVCLLLSDRHPLLLIPHPYRAHPPSLKAVSPLHAHRKPQKTFRSSWGFCFTPSTPGG